MRRKYISLLSVLIAALCLSSAGFAADMWEKGRHYKELPYPVKTRDASKVEVVEVFWYGCPHCYEFNNDYLPAWEEAMPDDVDFWMVPATFPGWKEHAKAFFAAELLGVREKLHQPLFDAIVANPRKFADVDDFEEIFVANGVSEEDYRSVFEVSGFRKISKVDEELIKAEDRVKSYRISGVPALIVNGKYKVGVRDAGNFANMVKVANFLIEKERQLMKPAAPQAPVVK